jgi:hypothetical protein
MANGSIGTGSVPVESTVPDGPPEVVRDAALRAFDQRLPGMCVADVVYDSWAVDPHHTPHPGPRVLRFASPGRTVEVGVSPGPGGTTLRLRTSPAGAVSVEVRQQEAAVRLTTDARGILVLDPAPTGILCFVLRAGGEPPVQTAWLRV